LQHFLGTDYLGRDLLSRMLYGAQITIGRAAVAAMIASLSGLIISSAAYLAGSAMDKLVRALIDALLAIPGLITALVILTLTGQDNPHLSMILALSVSQIAPFTQVARTAMLTVQSEPYCEAAEALGAGRWHVFQYYILPNCSATLWAYGRVIFAYCLLNGGALGFLGLGGEPGIPEWGMMLAESRLSLRASFWPALWPGLALTALVWRVNAVERSFYPRE
jgi:peptide/nickel transport system permease protein